MSLFNLPVTHKQKKPETVHPWAKSIKAFYANRIKNAHNSIRNPLYPRPRGIFYNNAIVFTIFGIRCTKDFTYCMRVVQGLHKYRPKNYAEPNIQAFSKVEWPRALRDLADKYGCEVRCISVTSDVIVLYNNQVLGGMKELKELVETKYIMHLALDYQKEAVLQFSNMVKSSGRACAYFHISVDSKPIGTLIFMLYSDICPITCQNFLRLCETRRGGYSGTPVHRIVKDGWIQCGGFGLKDVPMECENFIVKHDKRGVLSMANAGRHAECSTQFFVILHSHPWMNSKYVAFGQLIDGEETLRKIEKVETFYESPKQNIIMYRAGILNLDCSGIIVSKSTNEYIDGHIDDLVAVGDAFIEMIMEYVFLEIEFNYLSRQKQKSGEGEHFTEEAGQRNLHATERFIRKKGEKDHQLEKNDYTHSQSEKTKEDINNDFDVEDYYVEPEESIVSPKSVTPVKPKKPFFIPLTDVPYPGEKDSNFDLKRFLQGDYCLKADLDPKLTKKREMRDNDFDMMCREVSEVMRGYKKVDDYDEFGIQHIEEFTEEQIKEHETYLKKYAEIASLGGPVIKRIGELFVSTKPLEEKEMHDLLTDEELRRIRMSKAEMDRRNKKTTKQTVVITESPWATHTQIKRRQTGFIRPSDLLKLNFDDDEEDEEEEEKEDKVEEPQELTGNMSRLSSIRFDVLEDDEKEKVVRKIIRRPTGYLPPDLLKKLKKYKKDLQEDDDESDDDDDDDEEDDDDDDDDDDSEESSDSVKDKDLKTTITQCSSVRLNVPENESYARHAIKRRPTAFVRPNLFNFDDDDDDEDDDEEDNAEATDTDKQKEPEQPEPKAPYPKPQPIFSFISQDTPNAAMARLLKNISLMHKSPTLKDYKPISEIEFKNTLLTPSKALHESDQKSINIMSPSISGCFRLKDVNKKISADRLPLKVNLKRMTRSLRAVEYSRQRPALSINEYQSKYSHRRNQSQNDK